MGLVQDTQDIPAGAVETFRLPGRSALVKRGRLEMGGSSGLSLEAEDQLLVLAVGAATEAMAHALGDLIDQRAGSISEEERALHRAIVDTLQKVARDPELIRGAISTANALILNWTRQRAATQPAQPSGP